MDQRTRKSKIMHKALNSRKVYKSIGNQKKNRDNPDFNICEIGLNTQKSPGDLKRHSVTPTPVKDHQLTLVWETLKD